MNKIGSLFAASMQTSSQNTTLFATTSIYIYIQNPVHLQSVHLPSHWYATTNAKFTFPTPQLQKKILIQQQKTNIDWIFFLTYSPSGTVGRLLQNTHKIISQETMEIQEVFFSPCFCLIKNISWCKNTSPHLQMYNEIGIPHAKLKCIGLL